MTTSVNLNIRHRESQDPEIYEQFFELGKEETVSPFLSPKSRKWASNLTLKSSIFAGFLLILAFAFSFYPPALSFSKFLLVCVYFFAGIPSLIESIEDLASFEINIDILMTLAAFSSVLIGSEMEGALLLVLFALSGSIEDSVTAKAKGSLSNLHKLSPTKACTIHPDGTLIERSVKDITLGTLILVKAEQIVPLDGIVIDGASAVNLVHITGESLPISKRKGDNVPAGARNLDGTLTIQVTRTSSDSTIAKIIQLVTQAQEAKPKLQRWFDNLSRTYALTIISLAALFAISFPYILSIPFLGHEGSIYRALAFLIAASPCALIIAIPIAYLSAVSVCANQGIILKGGVTLDALANCSTIAFDKTGTLTTGNLSCVGIEKLDPESILSIDNALEIAYALEKNAVHPVANAILEFASKKRLKTYPIENFKAIPGYGLEATALILNKNVSVFIGNLDYIIPKLDEQTANSLRFRTESIREHGQLLTILLIGNDIFLFRFEDTLRPHIKETISDLKKRENLRLLMMSGDHITNAKRVADEIGMEEFYGDLKPEDKLSMVSNLAQDKGLAMVGDGVNDAPALARATVGICMGKSGNTAAIDAADVILLQDHLDRLGWLINKAKQTQRIVKQNLTIAAGAILVASLPALGGFIPLWLAVIMHEGGTLLVGLNALRLLRK